MRDIILLGNPNVGKTTLFNTLTKSNEKASNWHGVTVKEKKKKFKINEEEFNLIDLPGLYSLDSFSCEEKIASDYLRKNRSNLIINICDANNLKNNLNLTEELIKNSYKVILVVNMINDYKSFDENELSKILGVPVFGLDARKLKSTQNLKNAIYSYFFENNALFNQKIIKNSEKINNIDKFIENLNKQALSKYSEKIDKIILNKFVFIPLFLCLIYLIFYIAFGDIGELISSYFNITVSNLFDKLKNFINNLSMNKIIKDFFIFGILNSASITLSFLPQIILLMISFNIIEDIGLLSRFAFMLDGFMQKIGLTGKSLFSIMMGYGCTTTSVLTTRNLENYSLRKRTVLLLPFSTCSAKLPIFLTIASLFFDRYKYLIVLSLYVFSVILSVICACIYKQKIPDKEKHFIMEIPKYRLPYLRKIFKDILSISVEFIFKVGTTILFFGAIFWLLQNFTVRFEYLNGAHFEKSLLYNFSKYISKIFKPIGLNSAGIVSVLIFGLIAKELIVVGLSFINGVQNLEMLKMSLLNTSSLCSFTVSSSISFLIFVLLYSPCISALSSIKNEFGFKTSIYVFFTHTLISYLICLIIKIFSFNFILLVIFIVFVALIVKYMLQLSWKKSCGGNCNDCKKF